MHYDFQSEVAYFSFATGNLVDLLIFFCWQDSYNLFCWLSTLCQLGLYENGCYRLHVSNAFL